MHMQVLDSAVIITGIKVTGTQLIQAIAKAKPMVGLSPSSYDVRDNTNNNGVVLRLSHLEPHIFIFADLEQNPIPRFEPVGRCAIMNGDDSGRPYYSLNLKDHLAPLTYGFALALDHVLNNPELVWPR